MSLEGKHLNMCCPHGRFASRIFDDAESDSGAAVDHAVGMQNADKMLSSTKGGIFDDADEDSFVTPMHKASTLPDAHLPPQIVNAPSSPLVFSTPYPSCVAVQRPASPALSESRGAEGKTNTPLCLHWLH